jgi:DNA-binding transcriptional ArsR family regulator
MQIVDTAETRSVTAAPSFALDLSWALHGATRDELRERHPDLEAMYENDPGLIERVRTFWEKEEEGRAGSRPAWSLHSDHAADFTEMQALAHLAGAVTETDPTKLVEALAEGCEKVPDKGLVMISETERDRAAINRRLLSLRDDRRLRRRYLALLARISQQLGGTWVANGLSAARARAEEISARLGRGERWTDLVYSKCETYIAQLPDIVASVDEGASLLVAPCAYFGSGLYLNLDGAVIVGTAVEEVDLASRKRTEDLARKLKVLADPTRLAIVDYLVSGARSASEVTKAFGLAQPTVSNHLKALREAGLVRAERQGGRTMLRADPAAVFELVDRLRSVVA